MVESVPREATTESGASVVERLARRHDADDRTLIERAVAVAQSLTPERNRPGAVEVAALLDELGLDRDSIVASLLSTPEVAGVLPDDHLEPEYGTKIATLARNARRLNIFREHDETARGHEPAERLRRMILALGEDVRAVLIRLAYRTCRLRRLSGEERETRRRVAQETLDLYAPLANRLGVSRLKWEMEDLAFRYLEPQTYKQIASGLHERRSDRERFVAEFTHELQAALEADGIANAEVFGRPKHIYSIWRKMQRKHVDLDELFDVHAVRVLVDEVRDCYAALGTVHGRWTHISKEFDDYIANPKGNGYQSLHTAVFGPRGKPVEIQIRTRRMNERAERGVAAHWMYKEGSSEGERLQQSINALRSLLESGSGDDSLRESFGRELFSDRVFVFTPRGDVLDLPQGATVLDFAYQVHTNVGHRCRGAKVDGRIVPLTYQLQNGEQVEVLTTREPHPSRDWLNRDLGYLNTGRARAKARAWFNQQDHSQHVNEGRALLERELKRLNARDVPLEKLTSELGFARQTDLFAALGRNDLPYSRIASTVQNLTRPRPSDIGPIHRELPTGSDGDSIEVEGVGNLLTETANCCKPLPGDPVIGFITRGRGIKVHRRDCHNILQLSDEDRQRLIEVDWGGSVRTRWNVDIAVTAFQRPDLLRDCTNVLAEDGINVIHADLDQSVEPPDARVDMTVQIQDLAQLNRALQRLTQLPNVLDAFRRS
jgi:GTP pyrophosphokinase